MFLKIYILFLLLTVLAIADFSNFKKTPISISFFLLSFYAGFRYFVPDYGNYQADFLNVPNIANMSLELLNQIHGEYGYLFFSSIVKSLGGEFVIVACIIATVSVYLNLKVITKLSYFPMLSIIYYYSHLFINKELILMRAGLASSIVLFGIFLLIKNKSYKQLFVSIFIAACFHLAAIISLLLPIVLMLKISNKKLLIILFVFYMLAIFHVYPTNLIINTLSYFSLLPDSFAIYLGYESYQYELGAFNIKALLQIFTIAILFWFSGLLQKQVKGFDVLFTAYILSTIILLMFGDFAILGARLATMLANVEFILIPSLILIFKVHERAIPYVVIVILSAIMMNLNLGPDRLTGYENYMFDLFI
jgi:hypothetical protein